MKQLSEAQFQRIKQELEARGFRREEYRKAVQTGEKNLEMVKNYAFYAVDGTRVLFVQKVTLIAELTNDYRVESVYNVLEDRRH